MDDLYGFLRYAREEPHKQRAPQRIRHWHEYVQPMPAALAGRQAKRCMDCGTPACHRYCPLYNLIPEWNSQLFNGRWQRAYRQLDSTNNFPEFTGRVCPAPCEDACTLALADQPVTIKSIELAIAEQAWSREWVQPRRPLRQKRRSVLITGSGPSGLACAQQLVRAGYRVTVVDKADRIGGLLRYGIPDFRLEKSLLDRRLAQLREEGVRFVTGVHLGVDADSARWLSSADATVLACGAEKPRDLQLPGRGLDGICFAMSYLTLQNRRNAGDRLPDSDSLTAGGRDVVVIGGGDTGHDCVGTAIRQGARSVTQVQYHEQPPRHADILQYWPRPLPVLKQADTDEEGARRLWGWDAVAFDGKHGAVNKVLLQRLRWYRDAAGRWQKQRIDEPPRELPAQLVLLAMGYAHPVHEGLLSTLGLHLTERGNVAANDSDYRTSVDGLFSCGDMRRGQSLVVWAIREGRQCAHAVDEYLSGYSELPYV